VGVDSSAGAPLMIEQWVGWPERFASAGKLRRLLLRLGDTKEGEQHSEGMRTPPEIN
jgi:hypothetical protein